MLTREAIAYAQLGYLVREFNESKNSTPITDPEIEASIRQRLIPKVGVIVGKRLERGFKGLEQQKKVTSLDSRRTKKDAGTDT